MSNWKVSLANILTDILRLSIRICIFVDGIMLAVLSVYFTFRLVVQIAGWLNRTLFSNPW